MAYCDSCGTEVDLDAAFCSSCGAELAERDATPDVSAQSETDACEKCDSQISVSAERCPNCGHEPGAHGIISTILIVLGFGNIALMGLIFFVAWLTVFTGDLSITDGLGASVGAVLFSLPGLVILYLATLGERKTPTGKVRSWSEFLGRRTV